MFVLNWISQCHYIASHSHSCLMLHYGINKKRFVRFRLLSDEISRVAVLFLAELPLIHNHANLPLMSKKKKLKKDSSLPRAPHV